MTNEVIYILYWISHYTVMKNYKHNTISNTMCEWNRCTVKKCVVNMENQGCSDFQIISYPNKYGLTKKRLSFIYVIFRNHILNPVVHSKFMKT